MSADVSDPNYDWANTTDIVDPGASVSDPNYNWAGGTSSYGEGYDANGNLLPGWTTDFGGDDTNVDTTGQTDFTNVGAPPPSTAYTGPAIPGTTAPGKTGTTAPGKTGTTAGGLLGSLFGGGGTSGTPSGGSDLFGSLGALALGGGLGYLLSNVLSSKSNPSGGAPTPITMPGSNLSAAPTLVNPGVNPGYAMGQPVAPAQGLPSNLGRINPGPIQTINPQTMSPVAPMSMDQVNAMIGAQR